MTAMPATTATRILGLRKQPRVSVPLTLAVDPGARWTGMCLRDGLDVIAATTIARVRIPGYKPSKDVDPKGSKPSKRWEYDAAYSTRVLTALAYVLDRVCDEPPILAVEMVTATRPWINVKTDSGWTKSPASKDTIESVRQTSVVVGAVLGWAGGRRLHVIPVGPGDKRGAWHIGRNGGTGRQEDHYPAALLTRREVGMPSDLTNLARDAHRLGVNTVPPRHHHEREAYDVAESAHEER